MGLMEELKELKTQQEEELAAVDAVVDDTPDDVQEDQIDDQNDGQDDAQVDDEGEDQADDEPKDRAQDEDKSPAVQRKKRRERQDLERQLRETQAEIERLKTAQSQPAAQTPVQADDDPMPDRATNYGAYLEWENRQVKKELSAIKEQVIPAVQQTQQDRMIQAAKMEMESIESSYKANAPDYDQAKSYIKDKMASGIRLLQPGMTDAQVNHLVDQRLLGMASEWARGGLNPAEELHYLAEDQGFAPSQTKDDAKKDLKPDLSKVAENRKRNAGTAGASGAGRRVESPQEVATDVVKFARLKPAERVKALENLKRMQSQ